MTGYTKRTISLKTLWQSAWSKYKPLLNQYVEKSLLKGLIKFTKILIECSVSTQNNLWVRCLHSADVLYHLDCWLVWACLPCAIVRSVTTSLGCCKCNRQHRWLDIAITNMNAGPQQVYQTCMLVCTFLQIWLLVRCNCLSHGKWPDAIVTYMADGQVQM